MQMPPTPIGVSGIAGVQDHHRRGRGHGHAHTIAFANAGGVDEMIDEGDHHEAAAEAEQQSGDAGGEARHGNDDKVVHDSWAPLRPDYFGGGQHTSPALSGYHRSGQL